jgi:hypothetical protein
MSKGKRRSAKGDATELEELIRQQARDAGRKTVRTIGPTLKDGDGGGAGVRKKNGVFVADGAHTPPPRRDRGDVPAGMIYDERSAILIEAPRASVDQRPGSVREYWLELLRVVAANLDAIRRHPLAQLAPLPPADVLVALEDLHGRLTWRVALEAWFRKAGVARKTAEIRRVKRVDAKTAEPTGAQIYEELARDWAPLPAGVTAEILEQLLPHVKLGDRGGGRGGGITPAKAVELVALAGVDRSAFKAELRKRTQARLRRAEKRR